MIKIRTRFAPSPTGRMHLGNLWIAFLNWLWTRQHKGTVVLRMEDIDTARCKREYMDGILEDLEWMGIDYDEGPENSWDYGSVVQSERYDLYSRILSDLKETDRIYPCYCSRSRIHKISSAPHEGDKRWIYDGHCRNLTLEEKSMITKDPAWRVRMNDTEISFTDLFYGHLSKELFSKRDDFLVCRADGLIAYQLAVSIDDGNMGITHVFRGNDLLDSTPYQVFLINQFGYKAPVYGHLPLLVDRNGVRLSKRQHGITIKELRESGYTPEDIIGWMLYVAGGTKKRYPVSAQEALCSISFNLLNNLHKSHIVISEI